ncbi:hypothetical protein BDQ12DRAFT_678085 [Crucibulum laeve]|uniref:Uncharacterized protein n=1 Tax=Crucibulum laeve TaxID=68775 RepID=A0A5C3M9U6_9AGAR|nr:hypothetical protein BDQ12DRAFT_678085 [Crucibulum laeve]
MRQICLHAKEKGDESFHDDRNMDHSGFTFSSAAEPALAQVSFHHSSDSIPSLFVHDARKEPVLLLCNAAEIVLLHGISWCHPEEGKASE